MDGYQLVEDIQALLKASDTKAVGIPEELIERFGERCKAAVRRKFNEEPSKDFRLRMSNIGKDLRSLWLEKKYGNEEKSAAVTLKLAYGDLIENLVLLLIESLDYKDVRISEPVSMDVNGVEIKGTYDLSIGEDIYDIKTASPYAYEHKFVDYETLKAGDDFGYVEQLYGYSFGTKKERNPAGWVVINKVNGEIKYVEVPYTHAGKDMDAAWSNITYKVDVIVNNKEELVPPCSGTEKETWRNKETGREILGDKCKWCRCKEKCHPQGVYMPSFVSKAKGNQNMFYTKLLPGDTVDKMAGLMEGVL